MYSIHLKKKKKIVLRISEKITNFASFNLFKYFPRNPEPLTHNYKSYKSCISVKSKYFVSICLEVFAPSFFIFSEVLVKFPAPSDNLLMALS